MSNRLRRVVPQDVRCVCYRVWSALENGPAKLRSLYPRVPVSRLRETLADLHSAATDMLDWDAKRPEIRLDDLLNEICKKGHRPIQAWGAVLRAIEGGAFTFRLRGDRELLGGEAPEKVHYVEVVLETTCKSFDRFYEALATGAVEPAVSRKPDEPVKLPRKAIAAPQEHYIQAYRAYIVWSGTQAELADMLSKELKRPVTQASISKWISRVENYLEAGNVLPTMPTANRRKPAPMDPQVIEQGKRLDGRPKKHRGKSDGE